MFAQEARLLRSYPPDINELNRRNWLEIGVAGLPEVTGRTLRMPQVALPGDRRTFFRQGENYLQVQMDLDEEGREVSVFSFYNCEFPEILIVCSRGRTEVVSKTSLPIIVFDYFYELRTDRRDEKQLSARVIGERIGVSLGPTSLVFNPEALWRLSIEGGEYARLGSVLEFSVVWQGKNYSLRSLYNSHKSEALPLVCREDDFIFLLAGRGEESAEILLPQRIPLPAFAFDVGALLNAPKVKPFQDYLHLIDEKARQENWRDSFYRLQAIMYRYRGGAISTET